MLASPFNSPSPPPRSSVGSMAQTDISRLANVPTILHSHASKLYIRYHDQHDLDTSIVSSADAQILSSISSYQDKHLLDRIDKFVSRIENDILAFGDSGITCTQHVEYFRARELQFYFTAERNGEVSYQDRKDEIELLSEHIDRMEDGVIDGLLHQQDYITNAREAYRIARIELDRSIDLPRINSVPTLLTDVLREAIDEMVWGKIGKMKMRSMLTRIAHCLEDLLINSSDDVPDDDFAFHRHCTIFRMRELHRHFAEEVGRPSEDWDSIRAEHQALVEERRDAFAELVQEDMSNHELLSQFSQAIALLNKLKRGSSSPPITHPEENDNFFSPSRRRSVSQAHTEPGYVRSDRLVYITEQEGLQRPYSAPLLDCIQSRVEEDHGSGSPKRKSESSHSSPAKRSKSTSPVKSPSRASSPRSSSNQSVKVYYITIEFFCSK